MIRPGSFLGFFRFHPNIVKLFIRILYTLNDL
jgi:hypothetical protein